MKWLADENFLGAITRGLLRRRSALDIVRAQDIPQICGRNDLALLEYATAEDRIVLTHDGSTMVLAMHQQVLRASTCAPIVLVPDSLPIRSVIDDILLLDECASEADWAAGVLYLPLRSTKFR